MAEEKKAETTNGNCSKLLYKLFSTESCKPHELGVKIAESIGKYKDKTLPIDLVLRLVWDHADYYAWTQIILPITLIFFTFGLLVIVVAAVLEYGTRYTYFINWLLWITEYYYVYVSIILDFYRDLCSCTKDIIRDIVKFILNRVCQYQSLRGSLKQYIR
ncbi:putative integral membrane protein [Babesia bovis T2Bo]|uniref:Uncharacterized protein n=1 Tax=Babesia bovis TaxID=5865 RepID=S6B161_BABBO|nr:putative integral membrane protein [Babesia bovis T2Bo]KAG6439984.1 putative integral membrane protein [Babesia bovis T2Bo]BAN65093.1 hypothetical protein [Babesia bovis]